MENHFGKALDHLANALGSLFETRAPEDDRRDSDQGRRIRGYPRGATKKPGSKKECCIAHRQVPAVRK